MKIAKIIIHCSDSPDQIDIGVAEIRRWHILDRGWTNIGYHYVVRRNGTVEIGRYENGDSVLEGKEIGAHVAGHNSDSLGVCWVGRDKIGIDQKISLIHLVRHLMTLHQIPVSQVFGHSEFNSAKTCPNLSMDSIRKALAALGVA